MSNTTTTRELFLKSEVKKKQVGAEAARRRGDTGVVSCTVEDGGENWVLVTVREVIG